MGSIRQNIETVYAALAFIERNAVQEARPLLEDLARRQPRKTARAGKAAAKSQRPGLRAE
ncbi:MAG: hypothetical protein AB1916_11705 [Thermodesulfobacteriota bacterium]